MESVDVLYGSVAKVCIVLDAESIENCDSCCFEVGSDDESGAGLCVRVERGLVVDAHVWDPHRRRRHQLGAHSVDLAGDHVTCTLPAILVSRIHVPRSLSARLLVNGMLVQSRFPVAVRSSSPMSSQPFSTTRRIDRAVL